jgi:ketosteroid isomerase-like protein
MRPSVEDTLLIHDLYARYSWALDTGDTESYVQLYLPDAVVLETRPEGVREAAGHDEIRALVMRFHGDPGFPGRQHRTSQLVISPDPEGRADHWFVRGYVLTTDTKAASAPTLYWSGHTADIVAKLGGDWFIKHREIKPWAGDVLARFALEHAGADTR